MISVESSPSFDPAPRDPNAAIATLGTHALIRLYEILDDPEHGLARANNPWLQAVSAERSRRSRSIRSMQLYRPPALESPAYSPEEGPSAYLELVRKHNRMTGLQGSEIGKGVPEKSLIEDMIQPYVSIQQKDNFQISSDLSVELTASLVSNAQGILLGPITAATLEYERDKYEVIRSYVPEASMSAPTSLKYQVHKQGLGKSDMEAMRIAIEQVPYRSSVPDFYQMSRKDQGAILKAITAEWIEMRAFINLFDPEFLQSLDINQMPLAYRSLGELSQAVEQNPLVSPKRICRAFLQEPQRFEQAVQREHEAAMRNREVALRLSRAAARGVAIEPSRTTGLRNVGSEVRRASPEDDTIIVTPEKVKNIDEIRRLLADPEVNKEVLDAKAGQSVAVTELDKVFPARKLDILIDKHIELLGRGMWENMEGRCPEGVRLVSWDTVNVGELLRGGFIGNLRNLKITQLPASEEYSGSRLAQDISEVLRLMVEVEMKSTGKKPVQALISLLLVIHRAQSGVRNQDTIRKLKTGMRTTGPEAAELLRKEAVAMAQVVETTELLRPLSAGLPGLGKD